MALGSSSILKKGRMVVGPSTLSSAMGMPSVLQVCCTKDREWAQWLDCGGPIIM